ncbi:MAG: DUF4249 domain-containing protein [Bacteroidales bacterium]|nr:DUF4249 domain-containing protein [Bacteroidales bacterium]
MVRKIITCIALIGLLSSCEKTIELGTLVPEGLTIYALASAGQPFVAYVSHNQSVSEAPNFYYLDYADFCDETKAYFNKTLVVKEADATLTVIGGKSYKLSFDASTSAFSCEYIPAVGDKLELTVSAPGYPTATSSTTVEQPLELTGIESIVTYDEAATPAQHAQARSLHGYDPYGADSVATITFTFKDSARQRNYYRLKVRSVGEYLSLTGTRTLYSVSDAFTSGNSIFHDKQLMKGYGEWEPFVTNVFDDHLFDGMQYTATITSRLRNEKKNYIIIELQSISPELYYYLKSYQLYRISTDDVYSTPIGLYCNINNGWGILGSTSAIRYIVK